jgi:methionyl-tRNA synthetase
VAFYITTPIYYVNAEPHLGHAYTTIVADAIARARRLMGEDVFFLTGTDEHGQKVERAARARGVTPRQFVDTVSASFRQLFERLGVSASDFIRTTEPRHYRAAQDIWRRVRDAGYLYKSTYEGWYCTVDEIFVPEAQLADGRRCPDCGSAVERLSEESYFFRLSALETRLLRHYEDNPEFVTPDIRRNEMMAFVKAGLRDLSVSRTSFTWGIPVPDDPDHVMYVWFDALTNYLTAVGFGSDLPEDQERFRRYWPASVHMMGKEIVRQHAVYWPAFLMAAGLEVPKRIVGHGWWLMNDAKMSKSRGNVVRPDAYTDIFGVDGFRYFVLREMTLGHDASFSDEGMLTRYNADLANDLGNLASRTTTMIHRYCNGVVPRSHAGDRTAAENELQASAQRTIDGVKAWLGRSFDFSLPLREVWELIGVTNRYLVARAPWALAKSPERQGELNSVLHAAADTLRVVTALVDPVMPATASRLREMLGLARAESWVDLQAGTLQEGSRLGPVQPLFPRMEYSVEELRNQSAGPAPSPSGEVPAPPPADNRIAMDEFLKVELRVAKVLAAERVAGARKLLKMQIDLGSEQRTIVAGIAEAYEPEALVGRSIVVVANLKPARLMGVESNGMLLAATGADGRPMLIGIDQEPPPGTRVR